MAMATGNHAAALSRFFNRPTIPSQLIATEQGQSELKLNDQQKQRIKEITDQVIRDVRDLYSGLSREDRREKRADLTRQVVKLRAVAEEKIDVPLDDALRNRLRQVVLWVRGSSALADDNLAKQLQLTEAQQRQISEASNVVRQKRLEAFQDLRDGSLSTAELRDRFARLRRDPDERRLTVLDEDQRAAYLALKEPRFELTRAASARQPTVQTETQRRIQRRTYAFKKAGRDMEYALFVPSNYTANTKFPLIVELHGLGRNP